MAATQASSDTSSTDFESASPESLRLCSKAFQESLAGETPRENNLYVKNLPLEVDDVALRAMFQRHGVVMSCRVLCDHLGVSKQVAFVQMEAHEQALSAVAALHDRRVPGQAPGGKALHVALAQSKQERQRKAREASAETGGSQGWRKSGSPRSFGGFAVSAPLQPPSLPRVPSHAAAHYQSSAPSYYYQTAPHYAPYAPSPFALQPAATQPVYPTAHPYAFPQPVIMQHVPMHASISMRPHSSLMEGTWGSPAHGMHVWAPVHKAMYEPAVVVPVGAPGYYT